MSDRILKILNARDRLGARWSKKSADFATPATNKRGLAALEVPELTVDDRPASASIPQLSEREAVRYTGTIFTVVGLVVIGLIFQLTLIGLINYSRDQQVNFDSLRFDLANATAPVGPSGSDGEMLPPGTPVAIISAPSIGLNSVVVEGTKSQQTISGPGHRRDTVLPGQSGTSVIFGRQAAYGGPFGSIGSLKVGDQIETVTGQGKATYSVTGVRFDSNNLPKTLNSGEGRLTLVSAAGLPFFPVSIVRVDAKLTSTPFATPVPIISAAALAGSEQAMMGNGEAWPLLALALIGFILCMIVFILSRRFWGKWQTWVVAVPVLFAVGAFVASQLVALLPNIL